MFFFLLKNICVYIDRNVFCFLLWVFMLNKLACEGKRAVKFPSSSKYIFTLCEICTGTSLEAIPASYFIFFQL